MKVNINGVWKEESVSADSSLPIIKKSFCDVAVGGSQSGSVYEQGCYATELPLGAKYLALSVSRNPAIITVMYSTKNPSYKLGVLTDGYLMTGDIVYLIRIS